MKKKIALKRADELKSTIQDYLAVKDTIPTGFTEWERIQENQERIRKLLGATETDWRDWQWQIRNRIGKGKALNKIFYLNADKLEEIELTVTKFRW